MIQSSTRIHNFLTPELFLKPDPRGHVPLSHKPINVTLQNPFKHLQQRYVPFQVRPLKFFIKNSVHDELRFACELLYCCGNKRHHNIFISLSDKRKITCFIMLRYKYTSQFRKYLRLDYFLQLSYKIKCYLLLEIYIYSYQLHPPHPCAIK